MDILKWTMVCGVSLGLVLAACEDGQPNPQGESELEGRWDGADGTHSYVFDFGDWPFSFAESGHPTRAPRNFTGTYDVVDSSSDLRKIDFDVHYDSLTGLYMQESLRGVYRLVGDSLALAIPDSVGHPERAPDLIGGLGWYTVYRMIRQP
jgi:hypothetical protein